MVKAKTSLYLDKDLKEEAKEFFKSYGMSLSEGVNYLLQKALAKKELDIEIEPILPGDPDYEIAKNAYENYLKHPEDYVSFDEINWD